MKIKKIIQGILLLILVISASCFSVACNKEGGKTNDKEEPTTPIIEDGENMLHLKRTVLSVMVYDDVVLEVEEDYKNSDLIWKSSDESIATVSEGYVITKKAGKVDITVKKDNMQSICAITVYETTMVPSLEFNTNNSISLYEGNDFAISAEIKYNSKKFSDMVCEYEVENSTIAEVNEDGLITAKKEGTTQLNVTAHWRGTTIVGQVEINVIDSTYISVDKTSITLYTVSPTGYSLDTDSTLTPKLYDINGEISNIDLTLSEVEQSGVSKGSVATFNGNTIRAVSLGTAKFVYTCEYLGKTYKSQTITVNVNPFTIQLDNKLYKALEDTNKYLDVNDVIKATTVDSAKIEGEAQTIENNKIKQDKSLALGEHDIEFVIDGVQGIIYQTKIVVADKLITTISDLSEVKKDGYNVLTKDIDASGVQFKALFKAYWDIKNHPEMEIKGDDEDIFQGVFDGQGHTIYNLNIDGFGLFGTIGNNGIVKNVGFYNVYARGSGGVDFGICTDLYGKIENVSYYQDTANILRAIVGRVKPGSNISNFVGYTANSTLSLIDSAAGTSFIAYENIYLVSNDFSAHSASASKTHYYNIADSELKEKLSQIEFSEIFDMSKDGIWYYDTNLCVPLINRIKEKTGENYEYNNAEISITDSSFVNVQEISINGQSLSANDYTLNGTTLTIKKATIDALTRGVNKVVVKMPKLTYSCQIYKITDVSTTSQLYELRNGNIDRYGYYRLTQDIDMTGYDFYDLAGTPQWSWNWGVASIVMETNCPDAFNGVFDGQGHTISNIRTSGKGIFGVVGSDAIIKNISFRNVDVVGDTAVDFGLAVIMAGTLENVCFIMKDGSDEIATISKLMPTAVLKNVVIYANITTTNNAGGLYLTTSKKDFADFENVCVIADSIGVASGACDYYFNIDTYKTDVKFTELDFTEIFDCSSTGLWKIDNTLLIPVI